MEWKGRPESNNVEIDCLGFRANASDPAAEKCLSDIKELYNDARNSGDVQRLGSVVKYLQHNGSIKSVAEAEEAVKIIQKGLLPKLSLFGEETESPKQIEKEVEQALSARRAQQ